VSRLLEEILKDPDAVFELAADLPSGNRMMGTVGPKIGNKLCASITFRDCPASDEDVRIAKEVLNQQLGEPAFAILSTGQKEHNDALMVARRFMGGGMG
jgi:hypothetical protein